MTEIKQAVMEALTGELSTFSEGIVDKSSIQSEKEVIQQMFLLIDKIIEVNEKL